MIFRHDDGLLLTEELWANLCPESCLGAVLWANSGTRPCPCQVSAPLQRSALIAQRKDPCPMLNRWETTFVFRICNSLGAAISDGSDRKSFRVCVCERSRSIYIVLFVSLFLCSSCAKT